MNAMDVVFGSVANAGMGAWQSMDFGKAGMAIGAGIGLLGWGAGALTTDAMQDENGNDTFGGVVAGAFLTGGIQSAYSSYKEIEAFNKPNSMAALSSINSTTSNASLTNALDKMLSKNSYDRLKNDGFMKGIKSIGADFQQDMLTIDNFGSDAIKLGMVRKKGLYNAMMDNLYGATPKVANFAAMSGAGSALNTIAEAIGEEQKERLKNSPQGRRKFMELEVEKTKLETQNNLIASRKKAGLETSKRMEQKAKDSEKRVKQLQTELDDIMNKEPHGKLSQYAEKHSILNDAAMGETNFQRDLKKAQNDVGKVDPNIKGFMQAAGKIRDDDFDPRKTSMHADEVLKAIDTQEWQDIIKNDQKLRDATNELHQNVGLLKEWNADEKRPNVLKRMATGISNYVKDNVEAAESNSAWFSDKDTSVTEKYGQDERKVDIKGDESIESRMKRYVDTRPEEFNEMMNILGKSNDIQSLDDYKKYLDSLEPGALGTYKTLERAGVYGEKSNTKKRAIGFTMEAFSGSPLWARAVDHQVKDAVKKGEYSTREEALQALRGGKFKGKGGKALRAAGVLGDTVGIGGGMFALSAGATHVMTAPFRNDQQVQANNAVVVQQ